MTNKLITDISASIRQKLLNYSRETNRPFNELLQYFVMERFLYRLSKSPHADNFVLKGGLMFIAWQGTVLRPTLDIDLLAKTGNSIENIIAITRNICRVPVEPDGVIFHDDKVQGERIIEDADYPGVRIELRGNLGTARIAIRMDVGFNDIVIPKPNALMYPVILELPAPALRGYSRESVIAEKYQTMVKLGILNSRMKDFYDIWVLARQFDFQGSILADAISKIFSHRKTKILFKPTVLTLEFAEDIKKTAQWRGFVRKNRLMNAPAELGEVVKNISAFLEPVNEALIAKKIFKKIGKLQVRGNNERRHDGGILQRIYFS